jgi:hypothetical protein
MTCVKLGIVFLVGVVLPRWVRTSLATTPKDLVLHAVWHPSETVQINYFMTGPFGG